MTKVRTGSLRFLLVVLTGLLTGIVGEAVLRVGYVMDHRRGGDLETRLERSRRVLPQRQGGSVDMSGLVQASPVPDIVYELKPGLNARFRNRPVSINRFGMRDREYPVEKPAGVYRIAGLGDSLMFGWGVGQEEAYLKVLERELNALPPPHPVYEVMNFAVPGYNTAMEVATFEAKALPFAPDLVIIQFINNDFGVPIFMQRPRTGLSPRRSYLLEFIRQRVAWIRGARNSGLMTWRLEGLSDDEKQEVSAQYAHMVGGGGYSRAMDKLAELTWPRGIPTLILRGSYIESHGKLIDQLAGKHGFHVLDIGPYTDEVLAARGIEQTPEAQRRVLWIRPDDHHPNAFGHTIYAGGLMRKLAELGVIPGLSEEVAGSHDHFLNRGAGSDTLPARGNGERPNMSPNEEKDGNV